MRTINYTVTKTGITPEDTQEGGVQGEHKATALVFAIEAALWNEITANVPDGHTICYRVDVSDGSGGFYASELLTPDSTSKTVTFPIPREITQAGGVAQFFLVVSDVDSSNHESRTLYSFPARVRFAASAGGTNAADSYYGEVSGALTALRKALETFTSAFPIGADKLADGAVNTAKLASQAVTGQKLAAAAVGTRHMEDGAVTAEKLANGCVTEGKIGNAVIGGANIKQAAISGNHMVSKTVRTAELADGAVATSIIQNGAVTGDKIAGNAIDNTKLQNNAVTVEKLASGCVSTEKLRDEAVTAAKLAQSLAEKIEMSFPYQKADSLNPDALVVPGLYAIGEQKYLVLPDNTGGYNAFQIRITTPTDGPIAFAYRYGENGSGTPGLEVYWTDWTGLAVEFSDGSITAEKLAPGAVTAEKLADTYLSYHPAAGADASAFQDPGLYTDDPAQPDTDIDVYSHPYLVLPVPYKHFTGTQNRTIQIRFNMETYQLEFRFGFTGDWQPLPYAQCKAESIYSLDGLTAPGVYETGTDVYPSPEPNYYGSYTIIVSGNGYETRQTWMCTQNGHRYTRTLQAGSSSWSDFTSLDANT